MERRASPRSDRLPVLVLAGGRGRRLGGPKAWLDWEGRPLLLRAVERLSPLSPDRPLVAAPSGMELPSGPYRRVDDVVAGAGPLAGLAAGLLAIAENGSDDLVAVAACDYPFAGPSLFLEMARRCRGADIVLPTLGDRIHPLCAVWRSGLGAECAGIVKEGGRRVRLVIEGAEVRRVTGEEIAARAERALLNVNDPASLRRARSLRDPR